MPRILSLLFLLVFSAYAQEPPPQQPAPEVWKTVELEWEQVPGATSYEVRLTPKVGGKVHAFATTDNHLTQDVPVGNYLLQIRTKSNDEMSPWSEPSDLEVVVKEIIPLNPEDKATIDAEGSAKQAVEFKWTPVDKVREYTLKVWNEEKKNTPWIFTGHGTTRKLEVPPGHIYYWQVLFESASDVSYQQEPKTFSFVLQGTRLLKPEFNKYVAGKDITWIGSEDTQIYKAKFYYHHLDETEWTLVSEEDLREASLKIKKLKPGSYKMEVTATAPRRLNSESSSLEFLIKPTSAELDQAIALSSKSVPP